MDHPTVGKLVWMEVAFDSGGWGLFREQLPATAALAFDRQ